jgi:hypothetical protein
MNRHPSLSFHPDKPNDWWKSDAGSQASAEAQPGSTGLGPNHGGQGSEITKFGKKINRRIRYKETCSRCLLLYGNPPLCSNPPIL